MTADGRREERADASAVFGRAAADMLQHSSAVPLHPLMAHPAAAMAAATAIGFGFSTQMAGAFWGAVQGAVEATQKLATAIEEQGASAVAASTPVVAKPVARATVEKARPVAAEAASAPASSKAGPKPVARGVPTRARTTAKPAANAAGAVSSAEPATSKPVLAKAARGGKADDLKLISGIGPKLEQVLNTRGIRRFADLAALSEEEAARIDTELGFDGRILRDDWIGQARRLSPKANAKK